jgi:hypothetical protein
MLFHMDAQIYWFVRLNLGRENAICMLTDHAYAEMMSVVEVIAEFGGGSAHLVAGAAGIRVQTAQSVQGILAAVIEAKFATVRIVAHQFKIIV